LNCAPLAEIREILIQQAWATTLFLSCGTPILARLPWEDWPLLMKSQIQLVRVPPTLRTPVAISHRRKARLLEILGDETGLDFEAERHTLQQLSATLIVVVL
jgi:hypothetical protein